MLRTALTERLGLALPLVQASLGPGGRPALAAAVSAAGGLGRLSGLGALSPEALRGEIREVRARTSRPFGANLLLNGPAEALEARLAACLNEQVPVVSFFWGDPAPPVGACHRAGALVLLSVDSVEEARRAAAGGVAILVAQGWEAGGHVRGDVEAMPPIGGTGRRASHARPSSRGDPPRDGGSGREQAMGAGQHQADCGAERESFRRLRLNAPTTPARISEGACGTAPQGYVVT